MPKLLIAAWAVGFAYIVLGNYLYFGKVLPTLDTAGLGGVPKMLPSAQFRQMSQAAAILRESGETGWYVATMRRFREISLSVTGAIVVLVVLTIVK
jgi:hypothetical protein